MTLKLNNGTAPKVELKAYNARLHLAINDEKASMVMISSISPKDMLALVKYYMTNSDLVDDDDIRIEIVNFIKSLVKTPGYNKGCLRLAPLGG